MMALLNAPAFDAFESLPMAISNPTAVVVASGLPPPAPTTLPSAYSGDSSASSRPTVNVNSPPSSQLTEFTKRKNWPAKVVEELKDLLVILDSDQKILHVSPSVTPLTGYAADEVIGRFLKDLVHADDVGVFVAELNEAIAGAGLFRMFYRMKQKDGQYAVFESVGHAHIAAAKYAPNPNNMSPFCQAVFMMARPYPTHSTALLDSFLEHKIENERLKRKVAALRLEEIEDLERQKIWQQQTQESLPDPAPSEGNVDAATAAAAAASKTALTRENLEGIAGSLPDLVRDKMAGYGEGLSDRAVGVLTGLNLAAGERSHGLSMGIASPMLFKGDAGITMPVDQERRRKNKALDIYVCTDCGEIARCPGLGDLAEC